MILFPKLRAHQALFFQFPGKKNRSKNRLTLVLKKNQATICFQQVHRRQNVANKHLLNATWKWLKSSKGVKHGNSKEETRGEETCREEETRSQETGCKEESSR